MTCSTCGDKGIALLNWADAPDEYAVCLCAAGQSMRSTENTRRTVAPRWQVWAAREQVDPSRVWMAEDVLTAHELAERGFVQAEGDAVSREAALLKAAKRANR